jgi:ATP-binding cassette, subfamily B, bacterial
VIETGRHEELLELTGLYYAMWRQQVGERRPAVEGAQRAVLAAP